MIFDIAHSKIGVAALNLVGMVNNIKWVWP